MTTKLRNLTPHSVTLHRTDGSVETIQPEGLVPRAEMETVQTGTLAGVPVRITRPSRVVDLPPPEEGTMLIVSRVVASAAPDRDDLVFPDELVRDDQGRVVGCRAFGRPAS